MILEKKMGAGCYAYLSSDCLRACEDQRSAHFLFINTVSYLVNTVILAHLDEISHDRSKTIAKSLIRFRSHGRTDNSKGGFPRIPWP